MTSPKSHWNGAHSADWSSDLQCSVVSLQHLTVLLTIHLIVVLTSQEKQSVFGYRSFAILTKHSAALCCPRLKVLVWRLLTSFFVMIVQQLQWLDCCWLLALVLTPLEEQRSFELPAFCFLQMNLQQCICFTKKFRRCKDWQTNSKLENTTTTH